MSRNDKPIEDLTSGLRSRQDFVRFVYTLMDNLQDHPEIWENHDLPTYLRSLASFLGDADGYYTNAKLDVSADLPSWRLFADALLAARVYD